MPTFGRTPSRVLATPTLQPVHQPSSQKRGVRAGFAQTATLAQVCQPLRRKALRSAGQRYRLATVAWVLHDSRGNTFRFVVCRNSIQSAMALQPPVSNHQWQPHEEQSFDRKVGDLFLLIRPPGELARWRKQR